MTIEVQRSVANAVNRKAELLFYLHDAQQQKGLSAGDIVTVEEMEAIEKSATPANALAPEGEELVAKVCGKRT